MIRSLVLATALLAAMPAMGGPGSQALAVAVKEIRDADYRAERAELRQLASRLDGIKEKRLAAYREYWRGFALWRSAINGLNETPVPPDVQADLEAAIRAFRASLELDPEWIEPRIGLLFCWVGLSFTPGTDPRESIATEEFANMAREVKRAGEGNPRAIWFFGGNQLFASASHGGDPGKAVDTYRSGLLAARLEARAAGGDAPEWIPSWGAAENLMSLAYAYTHGPRKSHALAQAYADGALAIAPEWDYVQRILIPQIEKLPVGSEPAAARIRESIEEQGMQKVLGIGGLFFRSGNPGRLAGWYESNLGVSRVPGDYDQQPWHQQAGPTVFAPFEEDTEYFGSREQSWMINFRVQDLEAMVAQLRAAGIAVEDPKSYPNGDFARLNDPDGNPIELWQPRTPR